MLHKDGNAVALRFGIKKAGCSGSAYTVELAESIHPDEEEFISYQAKVVVAKGDLSHLDGTEIDYVKDGLQEHFEFNNPNVTDECGCGESFTTK